VRRFLQMSTDEVYGSLAPTGKFNEQTPLSPRSPYSASKAAEVGIGDQVRTQRAAARTARAPGPTRARCAASPAASSARPPVPAAPEAPPLPPAPEVGQALMQLAGSGVLMKSLQVNAPYVTKQSLPARAS
jgi:hypothetical protein